VKAVVNRECDLCLEISAQEEGTQYELASLFNKAYTKVTDTKNRATDVCPLNPKSLQKLFEANETI
jgi:hypothetical protein